MDRLDRIDHAVTTDRLDLENFPNQSMELAFATVVRVDFADFAVAPFHLLYRSIRPFGRIGRRDRSTDDFRTEWAEC